MWHASFAPAPGLDLSRGSQFDIALDALKGVGDASLGEWRDVGDKAVHVRRRLSVQEQAVIGAACDLRRSDVGVERLEKALRWLNLLPPAFLAYATAEVYGASA